MNGAFLGGFAEGNLAGQRQLTVDAAQKAEADYRAQMAETARRKQMFEEKAARDKAFAQTWKQAQDSAKEMTKILFDQIKEYRQNNVSEAEIAKWAIPAFRAIQRTRASAAMPQDPGIQRMSEILTGAAGSPVDVPVGYTGPNTVQPAQTAPIAPAQSGAIAPSVSGNVNQNFDEIRLNQAIRAPVTPYDEGTKKGLIEANAKIAERNALLAAGIADPSIGLAGFKDKKQMVEAESSLRKDYERLSSNFITVRNAYDRIKNTSDKGVGDMALVFSYMKVLDPTSTVRESEYANAVNAAGIPAAIRGKINQWLGAGQLSEGARKQIREESKRIYEAQYSRHKEVVKQFRSIADRYGMDTRNVIVDFTRGGPSIGSDDTSIGLQSGTQFKNKTQTGIGWSAD